MELSVGLYLENHVGVSQCIRESLKKGYHFVCVSLYNKWLVTTNCHDSTLNSYDDTLCDIDLTQEELSLRIVGIVNHDKELYFSKDCNNHLFKQISLINKEILYGCHLNLSVIIIPLYKPIHHIASICKRHLYNGMFRAQIWVHAKVNFENNNDQWNSWSALTTMCQYNKGLSLALELDIPSTTTANCCIQIVERWYGENISAIILPTKIFKTNNLKFPILDAKLKPFILHFLKLGARIIIRGKNYHNDIRDYFMYVKHIYQTMPPLTLYENHALLMRDILQIPLQPLADNLESVTYDIFEQDPIKYQLYKQAVYKCLNDKFSTTKNINSDIITIMVVGCGRGPLVKTSRDACIDMGCKYIIYALEKNINAIVTLEKRARNEWTNVCVVNDDMRYWNPPSKADIIVSELLGSFGDNELSPECLNGCQRFLKDDGVFIPNSYTSYLVPITAEKAYSEIVDYAKVYQCKDDPFQIPYVVHLNKYKRISNIKSCFTFTHPNTDGTTERFIELTYPVTHSDAMCHGFAGYFTCILYDDIIQSIHPDSHSPDMFSWFPIFFPIKNPILVKKNEIITLNIWRFVSEKRIWYEWTVTSPAVSIIHNSGGDHYHIDL